MNAAKWARVLAPRLTYRLSAGQWCDHRTYPYHSGMDEVDVAAGAVLYDSTEMVSTGWGLWEMADLGCMKIRFCQRCGHAETTTETTLQMIRRWLQLRRDNGC